MSKEPMRCGRCGDTGHSSSGCPERQPSVDTERCLKCGMEKHLPGKEDQCGSKTDAPCPTCHEIGHRVRECPYEERHLPFNKHPGPD